MVEVTRSYTVEGGCWALLHTSSDVVHTSPMPFFMPGSQVSSPYCRHLRSKSQSAPEMEEAFVMEYRKSFNVLPVGQELARNWTEK